MCTGMLGLLAVRLQDMGQLCMGATHGMWVTWTGGWRREGAGGRRWRGRGSRLGVGGTGRRRLLVCSLGKRQRCCNRQRICSGKYTGRGRPWVECRALLV